MRHFAFKEGISKPIEPAPLGPEEARTQEKGFKGGVWSQKR